ncbi:L,D-transpeptidase family protein [Desertivirga xinjiangensis]|uniref:L,D-transpeptidase family protein n=1 Tax=Desertivirga xinjiangensis TaxID=539206 RepID=UPI00210DDBB1|nr:L,D-transpeptidase family protein [Pedobacter xinjiangensis]
MRLKRYAFLNLNSTLFLIVIIGLFSAGCGKTKLGAQPLLDSVYITSYMNAEPRFKDELIWAKNFYRERGFKLGWFKDHEIVPQAEKMLGIINKAYEEGLDPKDYEVINFEKKFAALKDARKDTTKFKELEKEIDLALSATYFNWASDYYRGLVVPRENKAVEWDVKRNKIKLHKALMTILGERESKYPYAEFKPLHPQYSNLKKALARYRDIQKNGGWPQIPAGTKLQQGKSSPVVPLLRKRLADYMDSAAVDTTSDIFDASLQNALKAFQEANGLKADGGVGPNTISKLNIPVENQIRQIIINMERWRWIPKSFEPDYLLVNIPEYKLRVFEKSKEVMTMKVIVGKEMHSTPIFSDKMEYIVLSPYWNIPPNILKNEIAPQVMSNPGFLDALDMEVITTKGSQVDPSSVDWSAAGNKGFPYIVRRRPGPKNDLGDVKFIFPNTDNIYLHDTPNDELFSQAKRGFSHGCVRVERPIDLAEYLLRNTGWSRSRIESQISTRKEKFVPLKAKLPVYLVYFTVSADENGKASFFEDIYDHDRQLASMYFSKL